MGAKSVHIAGSVPQGSQAVVINMSLSRNWVVGTGGLKGLTYFVLALNGKTYLKVGAAFLKYAKVPASVCAAVCGKYVYLPAASASEITGSLNMQKIVDGVFGEKNMSSVAASGCTFSPATVNGQSVLQCSQGGYTIDVAAHGKPYPVLFTYPHGQRIVFTEWNSVTAPAAPRPDQVISLSKLG